MSSVNLQVLNSSVVRSWLKSTVTINQSYIHVWLREDANQRHRAITTLRAMVRNAHIDAKHYLGRLTQNNLDPLRSASSSTVANSYPRALHIDTKKAYFGEIIAGIVAENFLPPLLGQWRVPVFLFRHHQMAFDELERWRESRTSPRHGPGQTGDDCLAFRLGTVGLVGATLVCEGKCTNSHRSSMIRDAHKKISSPEQRPLSLSRVIGILSEHSSSDVDSARWASLLHELYFREDLSSHKRIDLVNYTYGQKPRLQRTWGDPNHPHPEYTGGRGLVFVEIHISDIDDLVEKIYS